jgi:NTP pyrophosphatase (non-canonical NTP hydrolase)
MADEEGGRIMGYNTFGHINELAEECHAIALEKGFWRQVERGVPWDSIVSQKLLLIHSEVSEAMEVIRDNPQLKAPEITLKEELGEEYADIIIRVFDLAAWGDIDIERAIKDKVEKNRDRPEMHGKAF